ncbi:MAG: DUF1440 domain-containing protein [Thermoanaerobaculia bacterium]
MKRRNDPWAGLLAGLAAGLCASWTMNQFQFLWNRFRSYQREMPEDEQGEDTTVRTARAVSVGLFRHELSQKEERWAGPLVHYAFGAAVGGLYGAIAEKEPRVTAGAGIPFGTAFWLVADESAVPLLGLSEPPGRYPLSVHLYALVSHWVFGATAEFVRRALRGRLSRF